MDINKNFTNITDIPANKSRSTYIDHDSGLLESAAVVLPSNPFDSPIENCEGAVESNHMSNTKDRSMQKNVEKNDSEIYKNRNFYDSRNTNIDNSFDVTNSLKFKKKEAMSRSEKENNDCIPSFGYRSVLANHHPMSPSYLEFIWKKMGILLLSFFCVIVFWILQFPQIFDLTWGESEEDQWLVLTLSHTFGMAVTFITLLWMILIIKVSIRRFYDMHFDVHFDF